MRKFLRISTCMLIGVLPITVYSSERDITLDEAMLRVLKDNPSLRVDQYASLAAAKRIEAAQQSKPYYLNLAMENFSGSNDYKGSDRMESTLSFSKVFELGSKAEYRGAVAKSRHAIVLNQQDMKRLDILAETANRFIHVVVDQHRLDIVKEKASLIGRSYRVIAKRVKAGISSRADLRRISIAKARTGVELEHAQHELKTSKLKLATMWGETRVDFSQASAALYSLEQPVSFSMLEQQLERNPELIRLANRERLVQAQLKLAHSKRSPDIELTAGMRQFKDTNDDALVFSARIPFGLNSRAASSVASNRLLTEAAPYDIIKQKLALYESLFEVYQELLHAYEAVKVYREQIIPEAEKALKDFENGYLAGRYSFIEFKDAQTTLLDARLQAVMSAANYHRFKNEIDRLTGAGLDKGV